VFSVRGPCRGDMREYGNGLILEVVKLTTVQVTRQPLHHKICKIGIISSAEPVLTED
jgi:hypothetical protein